MKDIKFATADDWTAVYIDGKKVYGNHSIDGRHLLELLGIPYESASWEQYPRLDAYFENEGDAPETWAEVLELIK